MPLYKASTKRSGFWGVLYFHMKKGNKNKNNLLININFDHEYISNVK
jgi:hypothetical protein